MRRCGSLTCGIASLVLTCANCGHANPDGAKFCMECGTPLAAAPPTGRGEERKVVTAVFCDLVGFTATSESADPEDIDRMLGAYFEMARRAIEAFGGTVEKFIGDAVVGVFGVPAAHEDDPERAVRAGLRICEDAAELTSIGGAPLRLRVGINTGEALVRLGVSAASGEGFLTGDSVNTASRIQSVAPEMGVAVGLATYEATSVVFDYEELELATLKGKSEPVRVFWAKGSTARLGTDLTRTHDTPFVGREIDLALLKGVFGKTVASDAPQLVTVIGEPGLGKSRIVAELGAYVDATRELVTWRQGRCLPYGEGITFWALGEILKAHAGILESDPPDVAQAKLDAVLPEGDQRPWFRQRLLPLLGIEATSTAEREELFTAWRRFLEHIAEHHPTVLVFEDLHWADDAMLSFLEHLADRAEAVPLLIIGTARPELFGRHPDYGRLRNATSINLVPLSEEETARLVSALLETTVIPAELQQPILERAGGNPLYAEEFVRLLKDKDLLAKKDSSWELREGAEVPFPDSVQALIAARLDTLSPDTKSLLADAAVIGKVFWAGAIAQMGDRDLSQVTETLRELSRKELVRPARRSSIEGEAEYAFWHVLARDVAYGQLPRFSRASRHVAAARWIESKAPERIEDLADVLAYHYATALELARAAGQTERANELEAPALRFLTLAGERALGLDAAAALANLERALALAPEGHPQRPEALERFGQAALYSGRPREATEALEEAIATFRARGDVVATARAMAPLALAYQNLNEPGQTALAAEALELLEPLPPCEELVNSISRASSVATFEGRPDDGLDLAERALEMSAELDLPRQTGLFARAMARCSLGDPGGLEDSREALALAIQAGEGRQVAALYYNLGQDVWNFEGPRAALETLRQGMDFADARGLDEMTLHLRTGALGPMLDAGLLDEILVSAAGLDTRAGEMGDEFALVLIRSIRVMVLSLRGGGYEATGSLDWLTSAARRSGRIDVAILPLAAAAIAQAAFGDRESFSQLTTEIETTPGIGDVMELGTVLPALARAAIAVGKPELAEGLAGHLVAPYPYAEHALIAVNAAITEARGDPAATADAYADAADRWERFGVVPEQAFALLGQGRCLLGLSRPTEAAAVLQDAREIFERLQAAPALAETDALLAQATALSS
jgi:class 3 adenylate cyclase/tetratricopeptide (TPR) repeat protein